MMFKRYFQQYFSYILAVSFIGGRNRSMRKKTTDLSQITNKLLSHNIVSSTPCHELTTLVVIGTDCTGSCKSIYHTITSYHDHDGPSISKTLRFLERKSTLEGDTIYYKTTAHIDKITVKSEIFSDFSNQTNYLKYKRS